ncbi:MAG: hypothetical protein ABL886_10935, partial [Rhodoglobus sp.]
MRIPKIIAAFAAIALALGGSLAVGLTAAADAPASWTVSVSSFPLLPDGELTFSGTKPPGSVPTGVQVTAGDGELQELASCTGLDTAAFSCS